MVVFVVALYPPNGGASRFWPLKALKGTKILVETQGHPALAAPCLGDAFLLLAGFWVVPGSAELQPPGQEVEQQGGSPTYAPSAASSHWRGSAWWKN